MKIQLIFPSLLYKRPVSKAISLYNPLLSKYNSNNQKLNINANTNEETQNINNKLAESVINDTNKQFKYLYSNLNNFQKLKVNNLYCKTDRYSNRNKKQNNIVKKNINLTKDNNSLFFISKDNDSKIFPSFNHNTCNISLNNHYYNIDYNNFASSSSIIKKNMLDLNNDKVKNQQKYNNIPNAKNNYKNLNNNKINKKNNIYLNSFTKNFPIKVIKNLSNSYDSFDKNSKSLFMNNITKRNKKQKIINLFVNPNEHFFDMNKTTDLSNYTNFAKLFTKRKIKDKLNQMNNSEKENNIETNNSLNIFKYTKKIVSHNSFNNKNESNNNNFSLKNNNIPIYNYKNHIVSFNNSQDKINDEHKLLNLNNKNNGGYNSFILNNLQPLKYVKKINQIQTNNQNNDLNVDHFQSNYFNHINNKINKKRNSSKNSSEKKNFSSLISTKKSLLNSNHLKYKKISLNNIMRKNDSSIRKNSQNNNTSLYKTKNKNNQKKKILLNIKKESSKDNKYRLNTIQPNDNIKERINEFPNNKTKLKKFDLNELKNGKLKMNITISKDKKKLTNLKKILTERFSTEGNKTINNNNLSSYRQVNLSQNKNKNSINNKSKKIFINGEKKLNVSLSDLLKKFRQAKAKIIKKKDLNKKQIFKANFLNKKKDYIINQSNINNNINQNQDEKKNVPDLNEDTFLKESESSTRSKKSNDYMEESKKLSNYIKEYYMKYNNYPQTNLNFYRIGKVIGQGGFAKVNLGLNVLTGRVVAIKSFNKNKKTKYGDKINMDKILYEINLMKKLNHQNITKILETFEDEQFYFIIMEYINGGNLFSYVKKRRKLSEKVAKFLFRQIILGINHIHSNLIVHRDIKLENILIDMKNNIKICDFGIGIILSSEEQNLYSHCGTPMYIAPEIILSTKEKGYKGFPVDIWSAGIALYIMVSGKLPFNFDEFSDDFDVIDKNNNINKEKNMKLKNEIINKEPKSLENISDELSDLLKGLLNKDPTKRLTCEQILKHPWFSDINSSNINLFSKTERHLLYKTYIDYRKIKADELIEHFTLSNLFQDGKNLDEKFNCESKSSLLAPFNSINYEFFNIENPKNKNKKDEFEDFCNNKLLIENDLYIFSIKAKELNYQYELDNNKEVDNGVLIDTKSINESSSSSFSNSKIKRNFINDKNLNLNFDNNDISNNNDYKKERILLQIENLGYDRDYIIKSLKSNFLNHATTIYFLLMNYEEI